MKTLMLVLALLMLMLCGQQQLKAAPKNDTGHQQAGKASSSVVLVKDNAPSHGDTAEAAQHQHTTSKKPQPALLPFTRTERFCLWLDSLNTADWTLIVTAAYLIATVLIWLAMLASNKHAEKTYEESKTAAEEDRKLLRRQLEAYERPWLTASIASTIRPDLKNPDQFGFSEDGSAYVSFSLTVKNIGKSLATNVIVSTRLVAARDNFTLMSSPRDLTAAKKHGGEFTLFPGEENDQLGARREAPSSEIESAAWRLGVGDALFLSMAIYGRVVYRFVTSDVPHHTDFAFLIYRKYPNSMVTPFIALGEKLSSDEVVWTKLHGNDAN